MDQNNNQMLICFGQNVYYICIYLLCTSQLRLSKLAKYLCFPQFNYGCSFYDYTRPKNGNSKFDQSGT